MASIQSPNLPGKPILFRGGEVNKKQVARDFIEKYSFLPRDEITKYFRVLLKITQEHAEVLYRNAMEERRQLNLGNISETKQENIYPTYSNGKNRPTFKKPVDSEEKTSIVEINPAQEFAQFLEQFKKMCRNPYARKMAKLHIDTLEEQESA